MQKYESYKDSGVDWLGDIPSEWNVTPGFNAYAENKRNNKGMKEERVLSLSYGKIIVKPKEKLVGLVPESFETYQVVEPGDLIIRCMDLQNDKTSLRTGLSENHGIITSAYLNLKINERFDSKFLYYYLHSLDTTKVLYKFGTGLRQNLSFQDFYRLPVIDIPKNLQTAIANFLDKKTAQIDEAIAIKEKQIELLKERKQIIIQQAVTQGLNPNTPMKDSGLDWVGQIPEHWEIEKLFGLCRFVRGNSAFAKDELLSNGKYVALQYGKTYKVDEINNSFEFYVNDEFYKESQVVNFGDIILISTSETIEDLGHSAIYNRNNVGLLGGEQLLIKPNNDLLDPYYIYYSTKLFSKELRKYATGIKVFRFNINDLKTIYTVVPPKEEQVKIATYIKDSLDQVDRVINLQHQQIEKLKEYKTTLINSAVTGKIKVPGVV
ncbi:restriction endonuclease subunit S [Pseudoalteromonas maricaloris]|nr:restriction endonuclease subunit S [Pseudoalteromonas maricaloris]